MKDGRPGYHRSRPATIVTAGSACMGEASMLAPPSLVQLQTITQSSFPGVKMSHVPVCPEAICPSMAQSAQRIR